jgi:nanoRNase/pAp phosphatase (c-di-AMP/oligoRNAs hydrolase)
MGVILLDVGLKDWRLLTKDVLVIDHHPGSKGRTEFYSESLSAIGLVYRLFYPHGNMNFPMTAVMLRDLWKHKNTAYESIAEVASSFALRNPESLEVIDEEDFETCAVYARMELSLILKRCEREALVKWDEDYDFPIYFVNSTTKQSEVGNYLIRNDKKAVAVVYRIETCVCSQDPSDIETFYFLSFRGKGVNVRLWAEALGGGGHDNAAGARVGPDEFISLIEGRIGDLADDAGTESAS